MNHKPVTSGSFTQPASQNGSRFYSPLVLTIASSEGVSLSELESLPGTGNEGRVTKKDILQYVANKKAGTGTVSTPVYKAQETTPTILPQVHQPTQEPERHQIQTYSGHVEIIEMDRMRKLIADHMIRSKQTSAHVTSFTEADVTNMVMWRDKVKKEFEKQEGEKLTFTPLFIEAIIRCIKKYPWLNSSVDGDKLIVKKDINIGMATALPSGNLIVPVIRNADQLNLVGLTRQVNSLSNAARNNRLRPDDTQGGTFTMTNVGTFGSLMGTPIINQPQVAILATGAIKKRPVVIETEQGDSIAIRHMMYLSLSYDHRIIDGALGSTFLNAVAKELENFPMDRTL
jgi:2-oxoglutarate dehydrogenase E2 component (dihydrolipoamide succinyltransferase)